MTSGRPDMQRRMCIYYLRKYHPGLTTFQYQASVFDDRLLKSDIPPGIQTAVFSRAMPRIDLLIDLGDHVEIIEAKTHPKLKDIAELKFYENALKHDSTRPQMRNIPKKLVFLTADDHKSVEIYAGKFDIEYIFVPEHSLPPPGKLYLGKL